MALFIWHYLYGTIYMALFMWHYLYGTIYVVLFFHIEVIIFLQGICILSICSS